MTLYAYDGSAYRYDAVVAMSYKFTGKERDAESGLDEFGARYYSSSSGRFTIPDWAATAVDVPYADFGNPQSLNLYSYVKNNPLNATDLDGHCCDWLKKEAKSFLIGLDKGNRNFVVSTLGKLVPAYGEMTGQMDIAGGVVFNTADNRTEAAGMVTAQAVDTGVVVAAGAVVAAAMEPEAEATRAPQPSSTTPSAPEVPESIPAGPSARPTAAQQKAINEMGDAHGCSTCGTTNPGTKSGNWVGDHQPPTAQNPPGGAQVYKPQCLQCSRQQGGQVAAAVRAANKTHPQPQ
jgi:RHS repeat-associated protein